MSANCNTILCELVKLCQEMIELIEAGMQDCEHEKCMLLYSLAMDSAFRVKSATLQRLKELAAG